MIMTGTTFRVLGVRGTLALLGLAGVLLPVGATWAQQPQEPKDIKVQLKIDDGKPELVVGELQVQGGNDSVVVRVDGPGTLPQIVADRVKGRIDLGAKVVIVSDSREEAIKELEARIAELKKGAAPTQAATQRIKELERIVDELKKMAGDAREPQVKSFHYYGVKEAKAAQATGDAAKIEELNKEVARIKGTLETALKELKATQEKIRKLGGDPGETPVMQWYRSPNKAHTVVSTYTVSPINLHPNPNVVGTFSLDPRRVEILEVKPPVAPVAPKFDRVEVKAIAPDRLEILEKRLKELQDEVNGLKKGSR